MKVYKDFPRSSAGCGFHSAVTLGTFDGVHLGHQRILERVVDRSRRDGIIATVITFDRHPSSVVNGGASPGLLTTLSEKLDLFAGFEIDRTFIIPFTADVARITADAFMRDYLSGCLGMRYFVVGYDHRFGRGRELTTERLNGYAREFGFDLAIMEPVVRDDVVVKSSTIRSLIREGDVQTAAQYLGRDYSIRGEVIHGAGVGRSIGIPTANLQPDESAKIIPASGVYAGWAMLDGERKTGVINVGPRPTFDSVEETIEVHLPDFTGDLYGRDIRVGFTRRIRDIVRFETRDALVNQIRRDIENTKQFTIP